MKVGISGYGLAGKYFHAPFLVAAGFEVTGIVTRNPERIASAQQDFPKAQIFSSVGDLVRSGIDLLVVASSNLAHYEDAMAGLSAGIPVVVDKPMGITFSDVEKLCDESRKRNVPLTTYFNRKFDSDALTIKRVLKEGLLGNIFRLDSRFERFRPEANPTSWRERLSAKEGGGNLLDLQPHLVSLALDWFGPAELVHASVRSIRGLFNDDVVLVLKHESGVDSYLSASAIVGAPGPRIRLSGDKGSLVIKDLDKQEPLVRAGTNPTPGGWQVDTSTPVELHRGDEIISIHSEPGDYTSFYKEVKKSLQGSAPMPVTLEEALAVAAILEKAAQISIR